MSKARETTSKRLFGNSSATRLTPPVIAQFLVREVEPEGCRAFQIRASEREGLPITRILPDLAVCRDCLGELRDPADRRFGYPYINCTNCGPRYSILWALPYDRANTTLAAWPLCPACRAEYESPLDRRYHAQPVACPACGPGYHLVGAGGEELAAADPIRRAAELLRSGAIVAIKGIGGYHLAADASNAAAVRALRERKHRKEKAFAVMVRDLEEARRWSHLTAAHERLLLDVARPIVLADMRGRLEGVAPESDSLGLMLPYAPLHHLLFDAGCPSPLVLTSGNRSSEPIAYCDEMALEQLAGIADAQLVGERPIARRVDDSVVTVRDGAPMMIRRARGFAPGVVCNLPAQRPILALGSDLKNAITLVVAGQAIVSQHIGDLDDFGTEQAFRATVRDLLAMYDLKPGDVLVAHDRHPQFKSTQFAMEFPAAQRVAVQHHRAHVASVLAEHELLEEKVIGVALDGVGYGDDGTIWGGEFFVGTVATGFERSTNLRAARMPGGRRRGAISGSGRRRVFGGAKRSAGHGPPAVLFSRAVRPRKGAARQEHALLQIDIGRTIVRRGCRARGFYSRDILRRPRGDVAGASGEAVCAAARLCFPPTRLPAPAKGRCARPIGGPRPARDRLRLSCRDGYRRRGRGVSPFLSTSHLDRGLVRRSLSK